jgi:hypothetical protein
MWLSKMKAGRLIAEVRTLHGLVPRNGGQLNRSLKTGLESSTVELAPYDSPDHRAGDSSFQQRLKVADMQGMTLREFETALPEG